MNIKELLQFTPSETAWEGLHPQMQTTYREAASVLNEVVAGASSNSIFELGIDAVSELADDYFCSFLVDKATELGMEMNEKVNLGPVQPRFVTPSPVCFTVQSQDSRAAAVVIVKFNDVNARGHGDWATADAMLVDMCDDLDAAKAQVRAIGLAYNKLMAVADEMNKTRSESTFKVTRRPSF